MSRLPEIRRSDRAMPEDEVVRSLERGYCARVATVDAGGYPYCVPMLYVAINGRLYIHGTSARGHLRANVDRCDKVCFEIDEPSEVFAYGRFECDTGLAYGSVIVFGTIRVVEAESLKREFLDALMAKYANPAWQQRPQGFYPRLGAITVYEIEIARVTGKFIPLPDMSQQWPARDRTMSPNAIAPSSTVGPTLS
jgi:nitroimidazol reductase NimA-like FMN-containing flavoprotein (pyridoxamine 5'-phosphate oxidase superfamily)